MNRKALSFVEVIVAISVLVVCLMPMLNLFGTTGRAVLKSQNMGFAMGFAHRISQHLLAMPFDSIVEVPLPGNPIADGPDDAYFNPVANFGSQRQDALRITRAQMPDLWAFLRKYEFRYALSVSNVSFAAGDRMKCVGIIITWKENGQDLLYRLYTYVPDI